VCASHLEAGVRSLVSRGKARNAVRQKSALLSDPSRKRLRARRTWDGKMMRLPSRPSGPLASVLPKCDVQIKTMRSIRGFASKMSDCLIREADGNSANRVAALSLKTFRQTVSPVLCTLHLAYQAVSFDHRQPRT
jgi:hypothetical protein